MNRFVSILLMSACFCASCIGNTRAGDMYECGTWFRLQAKALDDYHFIAWSDGDVNAEREIEVLSDIVLVAYFAADCKEYVNLPLVLKNNTLMLELDSIAEMDYYLTEADVSWYRVVDEVDDIYQDDFPQNDIFVCHGYALHSETTLPQGYYYAVVQLSDSQGRLCSDRMRSVVAEWSAGIITDVNLVQETEPQAKKVFEGGYFYIILPDGKRYGVTSVRLE